MKHQLLLENEFNKMLKSKAKGRRVNLPRKLTRRTRSALTTSVVRLVIFTKIAHRNPTKTKRTLGREWGQKGPLYLPWD